MNENENKTDAAVEQPKNTESVAAAEAPDTQSETGTDVAGQDVPRDGEGCESVTVVIIARDGKHGELMARSVKKNLIGVDADIQMVTGENLCDTDIETLLNHMPHIRTERLILMTEGMVILNPVTIYNIGVRKAPAAGMPSLMHKSVLEPLLKELGTDLPYADIADAYANITPEVAPIIIGDWRSDPWLLPVVSKDPSIKAVADFAKWKKFMHIGPESWSDQLVKFLEERFPE